jgi:hypothetical protein
MTTITIGDITISHPNNERAFFLLQEEFEEQIKNLKSKDINDIDIKIEITSERKLEACIPMH